MLMLLEHQVNSSQDWNCDKGCKHAGKNHDQNFSLILSSYLFFPLTDQDILTSYYYSSVKTAKYKVENIKVWESQYEINN